MVRCTRYVARERCSTTRRDGIQKGVLVSASETLLPLLMSAPQPSVASIRGQTLASKLPDDHSMF